MPFSSLLEAENYISSLNDETKQRLVSTISFMLINNINQQNNIDMFSLIQKMAALIPEQNQKSFLSEINTVVVKNLFKNNIDVFPIIHKLSAVLSDENKQKIVSDVNFIIDNTVNTKISITETQPGNVTVKDATSGIQPMVIKNTEPPPTPFGTNTVARHIQNQTRSTAPPLPASIVNKIPPPKISTGLTLTGTFNLKPRDSVDRDSDKQTMPVKESLKYIIPVQTEMGIKKLSDFSTPTDTYQYIKVVNGQITLDKIYLDLYSSMDVINFIYRTYSMFHSKFISFKKSMPIPPDKELRLRVGEWLVLFGYLEEDKLERIVQLHSVAVRNNDVNNRRFASKTIVNGQPVESKGPLFGAFLIESEVITKEQLNQALMVQTQYNEILANLK